MRIKHFFGLAVIAAMTASCSSNNDLVNSGNGSGENESGVSYASFSINLPTTRGTRADGDPTFDNGDANEYKVNDATLLLFKKDATTGKYQFKESVDLGNMEPWTSSSTDGITTTAKLTAKITKAEVGSDKGYYALIILNNNSKTAAKIKEPTDDQTYEEWSKDDKKANATNYLKHDNGFFMANAPKYVAGAPETLVEIKNIYASKQQAENSTATTVYVERGLAKVSLASGSEKKHVDITKGNYKDDKVDITGWTLDVTNTKTYPVHVTDGLWADTWKTTTTPAATNDATMERFHDTKLTEFPRVYWGLDPNYSKDFATVADCEGEFKMATTADFKKGEDAKKAQYCLENTFDIDHMVQGQTTRVLFSAKYTPAGFSDGETFYKMGNSSQLWNADKVVAQIKAKAMEVLSEADETKVKVTLDAPTNDLTKAGVHLVAAANVTHVGGAALEEVEVDNINKKLGFKKATATDAEVGLSTFESGVSYYIARVKHFGDDLTKWEDGNATYNSNNANWLGRYGVLRNNWYELSVNSVSGPGYPDVPKVNPKDPDDENWQYINVSVKILSWAKRTQKVDL
ncbi:Mfa1 family fimbria major subunit [uncultured Prevotella sp.]|uniref:Mfa1 family fimbria major subunit n=1 Tax=uncultured Prevotella sp. TaxID=159272 RepID=UPI0027E26A85|nr:Mfa1 family fimbria major subunit [uncultured Prevotella sp.]